MSDKTPNLTASKADLTKPILAQLTKLKDDDERGRVRAAAVAKVAESLWDNVLAYGGSKKLEWTEGDLTVRLLERPVYGEDFAEFKGGALRVVVAASRSGKELDLSVANPFFFPCPRLGLDENEEMTKEQETKAIEASLLLSIAHIVGGVTA